MHSNQSWFFCFFGGLEHQPSSHGWAESSPFFSLGWNISPARAAGLSPALFSTSWNISPAHADGLSLALWLGQYWPSLVHFILFLFSFLFFVFFLYIYF
jgi:hypothetical protein